MKAFELPLLVLVLFSTVAGAEHAAQRGLPARAEPATSLFGQGTLPYVGPEPYPYYPASGGVSPSRISAVAEPSESFLGLSSPRFDPAKITVDPRMSETQVETYVGERVLTRVIQKEGARAGSRDVPRSAYGYFDPRLCASTRAYSARDAASDAQLGHDGYQSRAARAEGLPVDAAGRFSAENEAQSFADGPPPRRSDPRFGGSFAAYVVALEAHLERHARSCNVSWQASEGHYAAQVKPFHRFCYSMSRSRSGRYYCIGLFTSSRFPDAEWESRLAGGALYR